MPFGSEGVQAGIGLALSGGGFRATLFHIGAVWRLVELGVLTSLTRVSSVSGGSIFAGVLASSWKNLSSSPTVANYRQLVVDPLRRFCQQQIDTIAIGEGLLSPWTSIGEAIESKYQAELFQIGLNQLPDAPWFVFNATNLQRTKLSFFQGVHGRLFGRPYSQSDNATRQSSRSVKCVPSVSFAGTSRSTERIRGGTRCAIQGKSKLHDATLFERRWSLRQSRS
jgi:hypothetical protein